VIILEKPLFFCYNRAPPFRRINYSTLAEQTMNQAQPQALFNYPKYWAECYGFTTAPLFFLALGWNGSFNQWAFPIYRGTI